LFYRAVLARFYAAIFLTRFRARSCEAFVPLGFLLSEDHGITGASSRNERFGFVILDFIWILGLGFWISARRNCPIWLRLRRAGYWTGILHADALNNCIRAGRETRPSYPTLSKCVLKSNPDAEKEG
jgi:hypothetical protein